MRIIILCLFYFKILQVLCHHFINDYSIEEFDSAIIQESINSLKSCQDSSKIIKFLEKSNFYINNGHKNSIITCRDDYVFKLYITNSFLY
eukprot:jgi/Orpsp1_1/1176840/evm.model.c7180000059218.1